MAMRVFTQSSLGRKLRMVQVPSDRPPRMAARCDILLSPGTLNSAWSEEMGETRSSDIKLERIAAIFRSLKPLSSRFLVAGIENAHELNEIVDAAL